MEQFDIVRPADLGNVPKMMEYGKKLGWSGICVLVSNPDDAKKIRNAAKGLILAESNPDKIRANVSKHRKSFELIALVSDSIELNRLITNIPGIDILISERIDKGLVRLLNQSGINLMIDFASLLHAEDTSRVRLWQNMIEKASLLKKSKNFILCSGGHTEWEMRSPSEMTAFGRLLGFSDPEIKKSISGWLIKRNMQRLKSGWIRPGVEVEK